MRKQHELFCCKLCLKHLKVRPGVGPALGNPQKLGGSLQSLRLLMAGQGGVPSGCQNPPAFSGLSVRVGTVRVSMMLHCELRRPGGPNSVSSPMFSADLHL